MSRAFVKEPEGDQAETDLPVRPQSKHPNYITMKGLEKQKKHLHELVLECSALKTSNGLSVIEHNHQLIDKNGLHSETDEGTTNLKQWRFAFRGFDKRGGGLLSGFIGGEH